MIADSLSLDYFVMQRRGAIFRANQRARDRRALRGQERQRAHFAAAEALNYRREMVADYLIPAVQRLQRIPLRRPTPQARQDLVSVLRGFALNQLELPRQLVQRVYRAPWTRSIVMSTLGSVGFALGVWAITGRDDTGIIQDTIAGGREAARISSVALTYLAGQALAVPQNLAIRGAVAVGHYADDLYSRHLQPRLQNFFGYGNSSAYPAIQASQDFVPEQGQLALPPIEVDEGSLLRDAEMMEDDFIRQQNRNAANRPANRTVRPSHGVYDIPSGF